MIETLFPASVRVVRADAAMEPSPLHPEEAARTQRMAPKRLREFALGRACARQGLRELGIVDFPLLNHEDRSPIWPPDIVGSITHCHDLVAVALARREDVLSVGLDAEPIRELDPAVLERITSEAERAHLESLPPVDHPGGWGLLLFCAKEAFYKAYYPLTRTFLGFRDAEVAFDAANSRFEARLVSEKAPSAKNRRRFEGRFLRDDRHLVCGVTLQPEAPPSHHD